MTPGQISYSKFRINPGNCSPAAFPQGFPDEVVLLSISMDVTRHNAVQFQLCVQNRPLRF